MLGPMPADVAGLEVEQLRGDVLLIEDDEPVGFLHVGGDLGEQPGRRDADGAAEQGTDLAGDLRFDPKRQLFGLSARQHAVQVGRHFVDGLHLGFRE